MNAKTLGGAAAVAVLSVLTWFAWLGWETSGTYRAWQVIGAGVTLIAVLAGAVLLRVNAAVAAAALTIAFTAVWTWDAARHDDSGLFAVGAGLLLVGLAATSTVVALVARRFRSAR